jgi:branched-chain amino acid transport system permease protein
VTKLGTAMRALANDREITATLGVPVRRVEARAWFGSGLACGAAGLLLPDLLTSLDYSALTFLVISSLAAALIGRLQSLWATLFGGIAVGPRAGGAHPVRVGVRVPLGGAVRARDRRAALPLAAARRHDLARG